MPIETSTQALNVGMWSRRCDAGVRRDAGEPEHRLSSPTTSFQELSEFIKLSALYFLWALFLRACAQRHRSYVAFEVHACLVIVEVEIVGPTIEQPQ